MFISQCRVRRTLQVLPIRFPPSVGDGSHSWFWGPVTYIVRIEGTYLLMHDDRPCNKVLTEVMLINHDDSHRQYHCFVLFCLSLSNLDTILSEVHTYACTIIIAADQETPKALSRLQLTKVRLLLLMTATLSSRCKPSDQLLQDFQCIEYVVLTKPSINA